MNDGKIHKKKKRKINRILTIILLVTVLIFFGLILYINVIPILYTILLLLLTLFIVFGLTILNFRKKRKLRITGYFFSTLLISIMIFIEIYLFNTLGFLFNITDGDYTLQNYNVIVLKTSGYKKIKKFDNKIIGFSETADEEEIDKVKEKINNEAQVEYQKYEDISLLLEALINKDVESIILENSEIELIKEENIDKYNLLNIIYEIEIKNDIKDLNEVININKEPFNIYISGIDTFGKINSASRSDVNIILTVNPKAEKILITWIPRDYYVSINNSNYKDKLTHAGIYGVDSSINAIEKLLDIDINYYVRVNFTSIIEVVDLLGGITVYNDEEFMTDAGIYFKQGNITLDGENTLTFVRERKNLATGDLGRGKNQIKVLEALINKAISPSIIKSYNSLLKSLDDAFVTNMNKNTMIGFIKKEISDKRNWSISSNTLIGADSYEYTYSYKNTKLYVMLPNNDSVREAKEKIQSIMK